MASWANVGVEINAALKEAYKTRATYEEQGKEILNLLLVALEVRPAYWATSTSLLPLTTQLCTAGTHYNALVWNRLNYVINDKALLFFSRTTKQPELASLIGVATGANVDLSANLGTILGYPTPFDEKHSISIENYVFTSYNFRPDAGEVLGKIQIYGYNSNPMINPMIGLTAIGEARARVIEQYFKAIGLKGRVSVGYEQFLSLF